MKLRTSIVAVALGLAVWACAPSPGPQPASETRSSPLYPEIEPFETGYFRVSEAHELYYELSGKPDGIPVIGLHGGPGGSSSPESRRLTDPNRFLVVLFDQRGAGRSRPAGELAENDTWTLVEDIEALRLHLGLDKVVVFGGSWGTTLGLAYAERYPQSVRALVLRGVFTATQEEIDHFYHGGSAVYFPDAYQQLLDELPDPERRPLPDYLYELITTSEGAERQRYCAAWARYEGTLAFLEVPEFYRERMQGWLERPEICTFSLFENYYMKHHCFLEEGQLLRNADSLAGIPTYIVEGRYDVICPPRNAWRLHKAIPGSKLVLAATSGHTALEPNIQGALVEFFAEISAL